MDIIDTLIGWRRTRAPAWLLAMTGVAMAAAIRWMIPAHVPFVTFFPAVMFAALVAGPVAGIVCIALSMLLGWYLFMEPANSFRIDTVSDGMDLIAFVATSALLVVFAEKLALALERLAEERDRREDLVREMVHRQKNLVALVTSIIRLSGREARSAADFEHKVLARLEAFAGSLSPTAAACDFHKLVEMQVALYANAGNLTVVGPRLALSDVECTYIGLALHELASNCVKHGAWRDGLGSVSVTTSREPGRYVVEWRERSSIAIAEPHRQGFGRQVLERVVPAALGGTAHADFSRRGLVWTLSVPRDAPDGSGSAPSDEAVGQVDSKAA